ncbi:MAG: hypothetical protein K2Y51_11070 [Gammaproteobacteria bacterium]|nr:hypothetical protein [Gammaproteobacteria bacterium]
MRLIVLARDRYENYFRRGLLEAAERDGVEVRYVGFRPREGQIDLVEHGQVVRSLPLSASPRRIVEFARSGGDASETVLLNTTGYKWFWHVLWLRYAIPRSLLIFDVHDWLFYEAVFPKLLLMRSIDWLYRMTSDGVMVLSAELLPHYPGSFLLDNASHVQERETDKSQAREVALIASVDNRLDFELIERLIELLPDVKFHFHGWVQSHLHGVSARFESLCRHENVVYHGPYQNADLDTLLAPYRIGLIPYAVSNHINRYVNPDKIYHYLRAGMEVVATPIPQALRMQEHVHLADTAAEFASRINALLSGSERKRPAHLGSRFHWSERWPNLKASIANLSAR